MIRTRQNVSFVAILEPWLSLNVGIKIHHSACAHVRRAQHPWKDRHSADFTWLVSSKHETPPTLPPGLKIQAQFSRPPENATPAPTALPGLCCAPSHRALRGCHGRPQEIRTRRIDRVGLCHPTGWRWGRSSNFRTYVYRLGRIMEECHSLEEYRTY